MPVVFVVFFFPPNKEFVSFLARAFILM